MTRVRRDIAEDIKTFAYQMIEKRENIDIMSCTITVGEDNDIRLDRAVIRQVIETNKDTPLKRSGMKKLDHSKFVSPKKKLSLNKRGARRTYTTSQRDIALVRQKLSLFKSKGILNDNQVKALNNTEGKHFSSLIDAEKQQLVDIYSDTIKYLDEKS